MAVTTKGKKFAGKRKKNPVIKMNTGGSTKPVWEMDYSERKEYIDQNIVPEIKDASFMFLLYSGELTYDFNDDRKDVLAQIDRHYREQSDYTEESLDRDTEYKVDGWEIVRKVYDEDGEKVIDTEELEEVQSDNTYNWSYNGLMDLNIRLYHDKEFDKYFYVLHPHQGGDIRGNYGEPYILEGDDKEDLFYRFHEDFISGTGTINIEFDDGSSATFDSEQDADVWYFRTEEVESGGQNYATLLVRDFEEFEDWKGDEFLIEVVERYEASKSPVEKKSEGGGVADDDAPEAYIKIEGYKDGQWFELQDYNDGDEFINGVIDWMEELNSEDGGSRQEWSVRDWRGFMSSEYSIDNITDTNLSESDFDEVYTAYEAYEASDFPLEVIEEYMADTGQSDMEDAIRAMDDRYYGAYSDMSQLAEQMVDEGVYTPSAHEMYVTDIDRNMIANEDADHRVADMRFEDLLLEADMEDEYNTRLEALEDEHSELQDRLTILEEQADEAEGDDYDVIAETIVEVEEELDEKQTEIDDLPEEMKTEVEETAREKIADEISERLENDLEGFLEEYGYENYAEVSFVRIDYDKIGRDLSHDYTIIEHDGKEYVFLAYDKGGTVRKAGQSKIKKYYIIEMNAKKIVQGFNEKKKANERKKELTKSHPKSRFSVYAKETIASKHKLNPENKSHWLSLRNIDKSAKVAINRVKKGSLGTEASKKWNKLKDELSDLRTRLRSALKKEKKAIQKDIQAVKREMNKIKNKHYLETGTMAIGGAVRSGAKKVGHGAKRTGSWFKKQWDDADFGDGKGKAKFEGGGDTDYYKSQLATIPLNGEYPPSIKFFSESGNTNFMAVHGDSAKHIIAYLENKKSVGGNYYKHQFDQLGGKDQIIFKVNGSTGGKGEDTIHTNSMTLNGDSKKALIDYLKKATKTYYSGGGEITESDLRKRFEAYSDEELQIYNGDNEETLKNWNRQDAIDEAVETALEETYQGGGEVAFKKSRFSNDFSVQRTLGRAFETSSREYFNDKVKRILDSKEEGLWAYNQESDTLTELQSSDDVADALKGNKTILSNISKKSKLKELIESGSTYQGGGEIVSTLTQYGFRKTSRPNEWKNHFANVSAIVWDDDVILTKYSPKANKKLWSKTFQIDDLREELKDYPAPSIKEKGGSTYQGGGDTYKSKTITFDEAKELVEYMQYKETDYDTNPPTGTMGQLSDGEFHSSWATADERMDIVTKDTYYSIPNVSEDQFDEFEREYGYYTSLNEDDDYYKGGGDIVSLEPVDGRKSFYGKAKAVRDGDVTKLQSYDTIVAEYNHKTHKMLINDWYSATTARHINSFLVHFGYPTMSKSEILKNKGQKFDGGGHTDQPYQVYNADTQNVEGYFDNEIEAEEFANQFDNATVYDIRMKKGGSTYQGGGEVSGEGVTSILEEYLTDASEEVSEDYQLQDWEGEEVETKSRDGFIPFTDGGYFLRAFTYMNYLHGGGHGLPTSALDKEMERQVNYSYEIAKEEFIRENPELVEELGEDKINYHDLYEADYGDKAEELSEMESDMGEDSIMFEIGGYYYAPHNSRGVEGHHTVRIFSVVNLESPYHRKGNLEDFKEIEFTFTSTDDLKAKLDVEVPKLVNWFNGGEYESDREMKIVRMAEGGEAKSTLEKGKEDWKRAGIATFKLMDENQYKFEEWLKSIKADYADTSQTGSDITYYNPKKRNSNLTHKSESNLSKGGGVKAKSTKRWTGSPAIKYANFEDGSYVNLLRSKPYKSTGTPYKSAYTHAVSIGIPNEGYKVFEFKTLKEAESRFEELVDERKSTHKLRNEARTENYSGGGEIIQEISTHKAVRNGDKIDIVLKGFEIDDLKVDDEVLYSIPADNKDDLFSIFDNLEEENRVLRKQAEDELKGHYKKGGDTWIQGAVQKMEKKGTVGAFTAQAERHGMKPVAFAKDVLANPDKYQKKTRERAQFVKNTNPEKFDGGGGIDHDETLSDGRKLDNYLAVGIAEGFESAGKSEDQIKAWAYIQRHGMTSGLQGWFGRTAEGMIETGYFDREGNVDWDKVYEDIARREMIAEDEAREAQEREMDEANAKTYKFEELSNEAQETALSSLYDLNVDHEWWEHVYEDAKNVHFKIEGFDIDHGGSVDGSFIGLATETAEAILEDHGETTETYKIAKEFAEKNDDLEAQIDSLDVDNDDEYDTISDLEVDVEELAEEFLTDLNFAYLKMLNQEYEYLTSEEAIKQSIEANDYDFNEYGALA